MPSVIEISPKDGIPDVRGDGLKTYIRDYMGVPVVSVRTRTMYFFSDEISPGRAGDFGRVLLADSVAEDSRFLGDAPVYEQPEIPKDFRGSWRVRVGYKMKPRVQDIEGETTKLALQKIFGIELDQVRKINEYRIIGDLTIEQIKRICSEEKLADTKVQSYVCIPVGDENGQEAVV